MGCLSQRAGPSVLAMGRAIGRSTLRAWSQLNRAPGYHYLVVERYGAVLAEREPVASKLPNGCRVFCNLRDEIQRQIWFQGVYEPIEAYLFTRLLRPGMVIVDAGANVGQYSLLASTEVGPSGSVHCFEPIPSNFVRLVEHAIENGVSNMFLNRTALWNEDGTVALGLPEGKRNNAGSYSLGAASRSDSRTEAPSVRLDTYVSRRGLDRIDLIKMDIEGAEAGAISGARATLLQYRPTILMEVNQIALNGVGASRSALWTQLSELGYRAWRIGHSVDTSGPCSDLNGFEQGNALFHHDDLPSSITKGWNLHAVLRWARSGW